MDFVCFGGGRGVWTKSLSIFTNLVGFGAKIEKNVVKNQLTGVCFRGGGGSGQKLPKRTKSIIPEFFFDVAP